MAGGVFDFQSLGEKVYKWRMWFTSAHSLQVRAPASTLHLSKGVLPVSSLVPEHIRAGGCPRRPRHGVNEYCLHQLRQALTPPSPPTHPPRAAVRPAA